MASSKLTISILFTTFLLLSYHLSLYRVYGGCFTRIFSFGDSITDTGNYWHVTGNHPSYIGALPYGETYFEKPTGRCSDGRLIVDFIAQSFGLQLPPPSMVGNTTEYFNNGANFAVWGARALNNSYFQGKGFNLTDTDYSLMVQLDEFKKLLPLISQGSDTATVMSNALFIVGEIGGNDYNQPLTANVPRENVRTWIPDVVAGIGGGIEELISLGAKTLVVPSNLVTGCAPIYLTAFASNNTSDYDSKTGCLNWPNDFSQQHNTALKTKLDDLRKSHPNVTIIYADYYAAEMSIIQNSNQLGYPAPLVACCGGPGKYNFTYSIGCGDAKAYTCPDPLKYVSWDGIHPTEAAYHLIADGVYNGPYAEPTALSKLCS
ncbi:hypothetical protein LUZ60_000591 [Juncus effusus]|nr:hypothetical protein LUZ60_000591 [Juncus effusus]